MFGKKINKNKNIIIITVVILQSDLTYTDKLSLKKRNFVMLSSLLIASPDMIMSFQIIIIVCSSLGVHTDDWTCL